MKTKYVILSILIVFAIGLLLYFRTSSPVAAIISKAKQLTLKPKNEVNYSSDKTNDSNPENIESLKAKADAYQLPKTTTAEQIESQYVNSSNEQIKVELENLEAYLQSSHLVKKANSSRLSAQDLETLTVSIRKQFALHKILLQRKIKKIEARI